MRDALQILLGLGEAGLEEKDFEIKRLSRLAKEPVVFRLRGIGYSRVEEIRKLTEGQEIQILLAGTREPNWKDKELLEKYGAISPAEAIQKVLLPGEIEDLSREVERLSGYRTRTITEIKKN